MSSKTEICNLALSHLGHDEEIANVETERSESASACRRFYDIARQEMLRGFTWPFAAKTAALGLLTSVTDDTHPTTEWTYAYQLPPDCLFFRRIESGMREDTELTRVEYRIVDGTSGLAIYTDAATAVGEYTFDTEDVGTFPPDFIMALSFRLASYIAPRLTKGDPFKIGERAIRFYDLSNQKAQANAVNEQHPGMAPESTFITARE